MTEYYKVSYKRYIVFGNLKKWGLQFVGLKDDDNMSVLKIFTECMFCLDWSVFLQIIIIICNNSNKNLIFNIFQLAGSAVLAVGIWLAVDKNSFIGLSKVVPSEELQVSLVCRYFFTVTTRRNCMAFFLVSDD